MAVSLGLDIGSNSVGSAWIDPESGKITVGVSVFPAGVDESDEKRGDPKNAKRRMTRRARITLARRALRKRLLRLKLIDVGLLPDNEAGFKKLLEETDPWELRRKGLSEQLSPDEFGRVLLHLAQRRGAMGFDADVGDKGEVKKAIVELQRAMLDRFGSDEEKRMQHELHFHIESLGQKKKRTEEEDDELEKAQEQLTQLCRSLLKHGAVTFGRFIAELRDERRTDIKTKDQRKKKKGPREWRQPVRNKAGKFEFHANRAMIHDEFVKLWEAQKRLGGPLAEILTNELRLALDDDSRNSEWRHQGLLFGQRMQTWDLGTLGRCVLEPTERCAPHADMYASRFLAVQMVNDLKIVERGKENRPLTPEERSKVLAYLTGPLGLETRGKRKGLPKTSVTWTDMRDVMGWGSKRSSPFRFNFEESDEDRTPNTDWFSREIIHGAVTAEKWSQLSQNAREGINRAILKHDPDDETHHDKLKSLVMQEWAGLSERQAGTLVTAWKKRPRPDAKRLNMSRRAVRNILQFMDDGFVLAKRKSNEPLPWFSQNCNTFDTATHTWPTQIAARMIIATDEDFCDVTTRQPLDEHTRRRYATGAKGATARDRHYTAKHLLKKNGKEIYDPTGQPLHQPPPAPLISNPVVRKAIHEVRRHVVEYMTAMERKPDEIHVELAREARMGKMDADRLLFKNRLRNRIRNDIAHEFNLDAVSSTQRRTATDRVILAVQQGGICPLCGNQNVKTAITPRMAAEGVGCEVAHILPKASGGHNGLSNIVLSHDKCNREMRRQTPRGYWQATLKGGFDEGMVWIERIYGEIDRPKLSEVKSATGNSLWSCYFTKRDDGTKIDQFKKDITDIQGMTERQGAATKYASRQVMTYLADSLFDGEGLSERGGDRLIYANDGMWTSRLRREWGLFFDRHGARAKGLTNDQEHERKEKDRGDHRHHAIDAVVIALCTRQVQIAWEEREKQADRDRINTADEEAMKRYRKDHPIDPPAPFKTLEKLQEAVRLAVFGNGEIERPVSHRPVKRKLIGALHEETLFGPVVDATGDMTGNYTAKKSVYDLSPNHLRVPDGWDELSVTLDDASISEIDKRAIRKTLASMQDPAPGKPGLVRDRALRDQIRKSLRAVGVELGEFDPKKNSVNGGFTSNQLKKVLDDSGLRHASGVPIHSVVLLRTMSDPVIVDRKRPDYAANRMLSDINVASKRAYVGGNNHHIEIRATTNKAEKEKWSAEVVTAFEAAQRKLAKLRACRDAGIPSGKKLRELPQAEREKFKEALRTIEQAHPLVDRSDNDEMGGCFVMSLSEGEMLLMRHKQRQDEVGYFVVAKINRREAGSNIEVVPHWDARSATERKDSEGKKVPDSKREQFAVTPTDLNTLAPPGHPHAVKVRVSPLGDVITLNLD
jgi:CRISPR-associated endonuclease Csn1